MKVRQRRLNGWRRLSLMPLLLLTVLLLVLAASLVLPGTTHAQSGNTITVASTGHLIARTTVQISAMATCTVPEGWTFQNGFGDVGISQASGRQIVQAFGNFNLTTCNGTAQTFQVAVTPQAGSAPFHGGPATATGSLVVNYLDASGNFVQTSVFTGPQAIRIRG